MTARLSIAMALIVIVGCGSMRSSPDAPQGAGGLVPALEDKEVGLVGFAPGFNLKAYPVIGVALFQVTDRIDDEGDRRFAASMAAFFNYELVRRLQESGLFERVVNLAKAEYTPVAGEKMLRLEGDITRLGRGSQAARHFAGLYGAGRTRAQADTRFIDGGGRW